MGATATMLAVTGLSASVGAGALNAPIFQTHKVGTFSGGAEPSIASDPTGLLYSTYIGPNTTYRSLDSGHTWIKATVPDTRGGDDCISTDQSGAIYWCNLNGSASRAPLQADVWKSLDQGKTWVYGNNPINSAANVCGTSCIPFGVDRQWVDAYIAPGGTTNTALVGIMYHDFYGPSNIWINLSTDGGKTFGNPVNIMASINPAGASDAAVVQADSTCNTVPTQFKIAKAGPHKGRLFAAWIAADPTSGITGCNVTEFQAFHNMIVATSDDQGATWSPKVIYDAGLFHDASSPFAAFNLDNQGNPYYAWTVNQNSQPETCSVPLNPGTPDCEYDTYMAWSPDQGATWTAPVKVNSDTGTHWYPAIAAGDPGKVAVGYLDSSTIIPTDPNGKQHPGGCYPDPCTSTAAWRLYVAESVDLLNGTAVNPHPTWAVSQATSDPMHVADICNLGIACPPNANRNLGDFISAVVDPSGCAHVNYADDKVAPSQVRTADQVATTCQLVAATATAPVVASPSAPLPILPPTSSGGAAGIGWPLLLLAGLLPVVLALRARRRT